MSDRGRSYLETIADRSRTAVNVAIKGTSETTTIRDLLGRYEYDNRGKNIDARIRADLKALGLATIPAFERRHLSLDTVITICLDRELDA